MGHLPGTWVDPYTVSVENSFKSLPWLGNLKDGLKNVKILTKNSLFIVVTKFTLFRLGFFGRPWTGGGGV